MVGQSAQRAAALPPAAIPWTTNAPAGGRGRSWPPADWPTQGQLTYTKELITVVLLLLALPWILGRLAQHPRRTGQALAGKAIP